jgi:curved DNA-binding protein CbpA
MQDDYTHLGISPGATPAEIKAAYHVKLKEFPAHLHPQEFKIIRAAYEALRHKTNKDFFEIVPSQIELNPELLENLREEATIKTKVSLEELMQLTF